MLYTLWYVEFVRMSGYFVLYFRQIQCATLSSSLLYKDNYISHSPIIYINFTTFANISVLSSFILLSSEDEKVDLEEFCSKNEVFDCLFCPFSRFHRGNLRKTWINNSGQWTL